DAEDDGVVAADRRRVRIGRRSQNQRAIRELHAPDVAEHDVVAAARGDEVAAGAAEDDVVAAAEVDDVVAVAAVAGRERAGQHQLRLGGDALQQRRSAGVGAAAEHDVVAAAGLDGVVAAATDDGVAALAGGD